MRTLPGRLSLDHLRCVPADAPFTTSCDITQSPRRALDHGTADLPAGPRQQAKTAAVLHLSQIALGCHPSLHLTADRDPAGCVGHGATGFFEATVWVWTSAALRALTERNERGWRLGRPQSEADGHVGRSGGALAIAGWTMAQLAGSRSRRGGPSGGTINVAIATLTTLEALRPLHETSVAKDDRGAPAKQVHGVGGARSAACRRPCRACAAGGP